MFDSMDAFTLARVQFAANMSFHILFPTISIALGWMLLFFRLRYRATGNEAWDQAYRFWVKIFALTFALGVVSGITMSFQFGTNWPGFMQIAGNVAGPLLAYEVLTAFFLEATFLGVMLFGKDRVSERVHIFATFLVALGTTFSAFWILSLNSWMHTPTGHSFVDGKFHADNWWAIIFNPSFAYRLAHMTLASFLTTAFLLAGISAWQIIKGSASAGSGKALLAGASVAAVLIPIQIFVGDLHGLNTLKHQPAKIAAMEGLWHTERGAPLVLFGWPDEAARRTHFAVEIPKGASLILRHDPDGELKGLDAFAEHPPVAPVFWSFRTMVGMGVLMLGISWLSVAYLWRRRPLPSLLLWILSAMSFSGWIATLAGWYVTEIGRQPWIVQGLLKTADVVASHPPSLVASTLIGYLLLYVLLIVAYIGVIKYMAEKGIPAQSAPGIVPPGTTAAAPKN